MSDTYDLAIIGGGINGCGIARDAAGRGLSVHLSEMNDLASGTSSWSTKLIHGGLRYLEYYEFRLVREALIERERLWKIAPHIIRPMRFVLPHHAGLRPVFVLRLGLFLYDYIGGRKLLPATRTLDLSRDAAGEPLRPGMFNKAFEYSDCWVDDARLVVLNARDAAARGATITTQSRVISASREDGLWKVAFERSGARETIRARALVNAAGPWVAGVLNGVLGSHSRAKVRQVQGSHIVVKRIFAHDRAYIFQNADGRIIFAIPYEQDFTLIGTTDRDYSGDPADVKATDDEIRYLCEAASAYFAKPVTPDQVVWTYSGVRPLYDDGASDAKAATRDYVFEVDAPNGQAPLLSIFGGKITTYRRLAEEALEKLAAHLPQLREAKGKAGWTANEALPGGGFERGGTDRLAAELSAAHPFLQKHDALRMARAYGLEARRILGSARARADLGTDFGAGLSEAEIRHLIAFEWARSADDILWRRTKLGLHMSPEQRDHLHGWMEAR